MRLAFVILIALTSAALAQQADQYWQQYVAGQSIWCGQQVVNLVKVLDQTKAELEALKQKK